MIIGNLEDEHGDEFLANLLEASSNINISKWKKVERLESQIILKKSGASKTSLFYFHI
jgi:hypothetical protein